MIRSHDPAILSTIRDLPERGAPRALGGYAGGFFGGEPGAIRPIERAGDGEKLCDTYEEARAVRVRLICLITGKSLLDELMKPKATWVASSKS